MTQTEKIYNFMKERGSITAKQAYNLGIMRLASRICDMRKAGIKIKGEDVKVKNRDGSYSWITKYSFMEKTNG